MTPPVISVSDANALLVEGNSRSGQRPFERLNLDSGWVWHRPHATCMKQLGLIEINPPAHPHTSQLGVGHACCSCISIYLIMPEIMIVAHECGGRIIFVWPLTEYPRAMSMPRVLSWEQEYFEPERKILNPIVTNTLWLESVAGISSVEHSHWIKLSSHHQLIAHLFSEWTTSTWDENSLDVSVSCHSCIVQRQ